MMSDDHGTAKAEDAMFVQNCLTWLDKVCKSRIVNCVYACACLTAQVLHSLRGMKPPAPQQPYQSQQHQSSCQAGLHDSAGDQRCERRGHVTCSS